MVTEPPVWEVALWARVVLPLLVAVGRWRREDPPSTRQQVAAWGFVASVVVLAVSPFTLVGVSSDAVLEAVTGAAVVWGWPVPTERSRRAALVASNLGGALLTLVITFDTLFYLNEPDLPPKLQIVHAPCDLEVRVYDSTFLWPSARFEIHEPVAVVLERRVVSDFAEFNASSLVLEAEAGCEFVLEGEIGVWRYPPAE